MPRTTWPMQRPLGKGKHHAMNHAPTPASVSGRRYDLDWLRIGAFALLIAYHAGMAFVSWDWHIKLARLEWLEPVMLFTNAWRLLLLFLISGIASAAMLGKGHHGFLASRSRRLLLPLLFGVVLIVPPQAWVEVQVNGAWAGSYPEFWRSAYFRFDDHLGLILPTWNHLWFVVYLWAYTALLAAGLALPAGLRQRLHHGITTALSGHRFLWLPMLAIAAIRITLASRFPETHDLVQDWCAHLVYGGAFFLGIAMGTQGPLWSGVARWWRIGLALGIASWAAAAIITLQPGEPSGATLALLRGLRAIQAWGMIIGLLGAARRWLAHDHRWREPLAQAVFPAYLIHQTLIVLIAFWLLPLGLSVGTQAAILLTGTIIGTIGFCWLTARLPVVRPLAGYGPRPAKPTLTASRQTR
jgi:hypothetical protein